MTSDASTPAGGSSPVRALFHELAGLEGTERAQRLARIDDPELREELETLLAADARAAERLRSLDRLTGGRSDRPEPGGLDPYGLVGSTVGGYRVVETLGGGGMGVVYRAQDPDLDRDVALKFLPPRLRRDDQAVERFLREAKAASALDHPAICTIHAIRRTDDGQIFIVMACYEGESLRDRLRRGALPPEEAVEFALQIARGLERAHSAGILHCDIKPANLMLTPDGVVKILDFGIARMATAEGVTPSGPLGTAAYMSPEQARGEELDPRADLWSLGVVLYEMVAGERPFSGDHPLAALHSVLHASPTPLAGLGIAAPPGLQTLLDRALTKDPDDRYPDASALIADLESLQAPDPRQTESAGARRRSADGRLPPRLTSFVGRETDLARIESLLERARLLTLTGPAGTGKTRLAVEAAARAMPRFRDGVRFVSLAAVGDPDRIATAIATALDVRESATRPLSETLAHHLQGRELLLVLDNFEHVLEAAPLVTELLGRCPNLRTLVTSRVLLRVTGEHEYRVPPLALPDLERPDAGTALEDSPATALFLQRAAAVEPDLELAPEDARAIAEICVKLDGLPLAIELAAARTRILAPRAILERLGRRLDLLTRGPRDGPARHRTLRQAIAWSYDLLDPEEQALYRQLAVFAGGATPRAAARVAGEPHDDPMAALDALSALTEKSLLQRGRDADETPRFFMLETIREFGLEQLREAGEEDPAFRAHARRFTELAERAAPELTGPDQADWVARLRADEDNLRAALDWAIEQRETELGLRLGAALWRFWAYRGSLREGRDRLESLLSLPARDPISPERAAVLNGLGTLIHETSQFETARPYLEEALEIWRALDDRRGVATALNNLGVVANFLSDVDRARQLHRDALELSRDLGERRGEALALNNQGWLALMQGNFSRARELFQRDLEIRRELGDERGRAYALINRSAAEQALGRYESAMEALESALSTLRSLGEGQIVGWALYIQGDIELDRGNYTVADEIFTRAIEAWRRSGNQAGLAWSTVGLGETALERGDLERAESLLREGLDLWRWTGSRHGEARALCALGRLNRDADDPGRARELLSSSLTIRAEIGDRAGLARCFEELALLYARTGEASRGAALVGAAEALRGEIASPLPPRFRDAWQGLIDRLRAQLGEQTFSRHRRQGRDIHLDRAVRLARLEG